MADYRGKFPFLPFIYVGDICELGDVMLNILCFREVTEGWRKIHSASVIIFNLHILLFG